MKKLKKTVLLIAGPGSIIFLAVTLFIHLFTTVNAKPFIIAGLIIFFVVFIPLYTVEYFRQEFKKDDHKKVHFKRSQGRTEWRGGNIHGKVPHKSEKPGRLFKG